MTAPKLAIASSGYGGRGYRNPWSGEVVPSVTTCLGALDKGGILQWSVDQTVSRMAVDFESLRDLEPEQIFNRERFGLSRVKSADFDDPYIEWTQAHTNVLNDLAELGTRVHEWIEADLNGWFEPEIYSSAQEQMIIAWLEWKADQDIEVYHTEATVFGDGYAGTVDVFWKLNGENRLDDFKTSRAVRREHVAQLSALGAADLLAREVLEGTEGAVGHKPRKSDKEYSSWWVKDVPPPVQGYGVIQLRPDDQGKYGEPIPAFCTHHKISQKRIDASYDFFIAARDARVAEKKIKAAEKEDA